MYKNAVRLYSRLYAVGFLGFHRPSGLRRRKSGIQAKSRRRVVVKK